MTKGGKTVTFEELGHFELPPETDTYKPIPHQDLVRMVEDRAVKELELPSRDHINWQHAINKEGRQYFGLGAVPSIKLGQHSCLQIALKGSYDKSSSNVLGLGGAVFYCMNGIMSVDLIKASRVHTGKMWDDLRRLIWETFDGAVDKARHLVEKTEAWEQLPISQDDGYRTIGLMLGRGLLTPTLGSKMVSAWREPGIQNFKERNVWSLYNAATYAIKAVTPGRGLRMHTGVHKFFSQDVVEAQYETIN
jgi:hypothetical protein